MRYWRLSSCSARSARALSKGQALADAEVLQRLDQHVLLELLQADEVDVGHDGAFVDDDDDDTGLDVDAHVLEKVRWRRAHAARPHPSRRCRCRRREKAATRTRCRHRCAAGPRRGCPSARRARRPRKKCTVKERQRVRGKRQRDETHSGVRKVACVGSVQAQQAGHVVVESQGHHHEHDGHSPRAAVCRATTRRQAAPSHPRKDNTSGALHRAWAAGAG